MVAHLWKTSYGWTLELAEGDPVNGWRVVSTHHYQSKVDAKRAAALAGAKPWNY